MSAHMSHVPRYPSTELGVSVIYLYTSLLEYSNNIQILLSTFLPFFLFFLTGKFKPNTTHVSDLFFFYSFLILFIVFVILSNPALHNPKSIIPELRSLLPLRRICAPPPTAPTLRLTASSFSSFYLFIFKSYLNIIFRTDGSFITFSQFSMFAHSTLNLKQYVN